MLLLNFNFVFLYKTVYRGEELLLTYFCFLVFIHICKCLDALELINTKQIFINI